MGDNLLLRSNGDGEGNDEGGPENKAECEEHVTRGAFPVVKLKKTGRHEGKKGSEGRK